MSARDVLCVALAADRYEPEEWIETAAHLLDALQTAGYAVIELPKPGELSDHHDDTDVVFYYGQEGEVLRGDPGDVWIDDHLFSSESAREFAAAILAAADASEAVDE